MKTINSAIAKITILSALGALCACQTNTAQNANQTNQPSNIPMVNAAPSATPSAENTKENVTRPEIKTGSGASLATPTETYKTAYAARKNKDFETLKRVMSKDMREFLLIMSDGKPLDDALLQMTETPQAPTDESRGEKISGDKATLEYPDENGKWKTMDFVKEGGEWKITFPKDKIEVDNSDPDKLKR